MVTTHDRGTMTVGATAKITTSDVKPAGAGIFVFVEATWSMPSEMRLLGIQRRRNRQVALSQLGAGSPLCWPTCSTPPQRRWVGDTWGRLSRGLPEDGCRVMDFGGTNDRGRERRSKATEAASAVARSLGIDCSRLAILTDSNNTIVHLAPAPIIAKVATTTIRPGAPELLERELSIGLHLTSREAPIAPPASSVAPGPHRYGLTVLTLWEIREHVPDRVVEPAQLAAVLRELHAALADYSGDLPTFVGQLEQAGTVLSDPSRTPTLPPNDRVLLRTLQRRMLDSLQAIDAPVQPLHSDPHVDGNVLSTTAGPVFVEFEAACIGPKEWDLSSLGREVAVFYPPVDFGLLETLRLVRSLCVATWCWTQPERAPEVEEAARYHLTRLRKKMQT